VVVHDLDLRWPIGRPAETDPELIVDSNAVLPTPVSPQGFEPIPWRGTQVVEGASLVEHQELPFRHTGEGDEPPDPLAAEQRLGVGALEGPYQRR
jgi:hypothetical protein